MALNPPTIREDDTVLLGTLDAMYAMAHAMIQGFTSEALAALYGELVSNEPLAIGFAVKKALEKSVLAIKTERTDKALDAVRELGEK